MHGKGVIYYQQSVREKDERFEGQFQLNSREGHGILTKRNGDIFEGNFSQNHPNGQTKIFFANGENYEGEVIRGVMTGKGFL